MEALALRRFCVDPGVRGCGVALFEGGELLQAGYAEAPHGEPRDLDRALRCVRSARAAYEWFFKADAAEPNVTLYGLKVVLEWPQVYRAGRGRGDPNDLLPLTCVLGAIAGHFHSETPVVTYLPREWKGQVPKDVMVERIKSRLTPEELARVELPAKSLQHNVWDAVGLGLKDLGRL